MRFFTKQELLVVLGILAVIVSVSLYNFRTSIRRARDAQRKTDLGVIGGALNKYNEDMGGYPLNSIQGEILACEPLTKVGQKTIFSPCICGKDGVRDLSDLAFPAYITSLPLDPRTGQGRNYVYISNGKRFQLLASLEGDDEAEYNQKIVARGIKCGQYNCNFGVASGNTPLEKSIEEYENEINVEK